ncbi:hypothetical protein [Leuconostoc suionicum]|uniref:hypothetical protein n=1 Tax=Leuconostoc suionicum TaxID=1511761 RepID=UPI00233E6C10|nr:hypothetical protein [Leuconostoc suionicum]MDC2805077.1 hypothetical protein [Leuconostoc suionicum]MDC2822589.1 hypothetical protein [Leuconostoc suionicum]
MNDEAIENTAIRYFSWSDEQSTGGSEILVSENPSNSSGEIDLSDDEALRLSAFIMQELAEGKHVTLRTTI